MRHSKDLYTTPRVTHQNDGFLHLLNSQNIDAKHTDKRQKTKIDRDDRAGCTI